VAHTSPHKLIGWLGSLPVRANDDGTLEIGSRRYVEIEPWLVQQQDGDRTLSFQQRDGQTWLFWEQLAYFKVPWHQTLSFHLALLGISVLLFVSVWIGWPLAAWLNRRRDKPPNQSIRLARWLAAGLGLFNLGLLARFALLMIGYGETYIYPSAAVNLITRLTWLSVPLSLAVLAMAVRAWLKREMHWTWRVHYTLVALAAVGMLWFMAFWNLLAGV